MATPRTRDVETPQGTLALFLDGRLLALVPDDLVVTNPETTPPWLASA